MRYMLLIYADEQVLDDTAREKCYEEAAHVAQELKASGHFLDAAPLHQTSTATSVKMREGKRHVTDGPFAETREQLGGYYVIDAANQDDAIAIAARLPMARWGTIEVRPIVEIPGLPTG